MARRTLRAPSLPEAMVRIRAEHGPGAVVTGWKQVTGGVELEIAVPDGADTRPGAPPRSAGQAEPAPWLSGIEPDPRSPASADLPADQSEFAAWNSVVEARRGRPERPRAPRFDVFAVPEPGRRQVRPAPASASPAPAGADPAASAPQPPAPGPVSAASRRALTPREAELLRLGLPAASLPAWAPVARGPDMVRALEAALVARLRLAPGRDLPSRPQLLAGPPGSGKTVMAAKLAARAIQQGGSVILIGTDTDRTGASDQIGGFARRLGARFREAPGLALAARFAREGVEAGHVVLVDTPAASHLSRPDLLLVRRLAEDTGAELLACLPADARADDLADAARVWADAGAAAAALTRLDLTLRRLGALDACGQADLPVAWIGTGPWIAGALEAAGARAIASGIAEAVSAARPAGTGTGSSSGFGSGAGPRPHARTA